MKKLVSCTLLASLLTATMPWHAFASQDSKATTKSQVSDWGPGVKVRLSAGSEATVEQFPGKISASNIKGRIHVKLDGTSKVVLKTGSGTIVANSGEFLVDGGDKHSKLHVFKGDAHVEGPKSDVDLPVDAGAWVPAGQQVALRGSDVRRRQGDPDEFSRRRDRARGAGKEKAPKVKSLPVNNTTTPPVNNTPPVNTTVTPPVNTTAPPVTTQPPVNTNPPVVGGGGFNPLWLLIPAGGIAALAAAGGGDNNNGVVAPASP